jgi:hypothetical protein
VRTAGVPLGKHPGPTRETWVIDDSVSCALGAWTGAVSIVLVTAGDCLLAGRLGALSLPVLDSNTLPRGSDCK